MKSSELVERLRDQIQVGDSRPGQAETELQHTVATCADPFGRAQRKAAGLTFHAWHSRGDESVRTHLLRS